MFDNNKLVASLVLYDDVIIALNIIQSYDNSSELLELFLYLCVSIINNIILKEKNLLQHVCALMQEGKYLKIIYEEQYENTYLHTNNNTIEHFNTHYTNNNTKEHGYIKSGLMV